MQQVQVFRCRICGDPYIGFERPSNCPFCGAHESYMIPSVEWKDTNKVKLTEVSRKNLEASLELEISNAEFYLCVARTGAREEIRAMYKALSKVEAEHASTISKILRVEKPLITLKKGICQMTEEEILEESDRRENRAVKMYGQFLAQATEPRVKELFKALVEIESDHIDLINDEIGEETVLEKDKEAHKRIDEDLKKLDKTEMEYYESYKAHQD